MAGMFYSLKETAAKLGKTEQEVRQLAKEGTLREFRDGANLMFKIDEVEALSKAAPAPEALEPEVQPDLELAEADGLDLGPESPASDAVGSEELESLFALDGDESGKEGAEAKDAGLEHADDLQLEEALTPEVSEELTPAGEGSEPVLDLSDTQHLAGAEAEQPAASGSGSPEDDIFLAAETGAGSGEAQASGQDTALTGEGISVLGDGDKEYKLTDDTLAETMAGLGASGEASLEEIEKDVNLDSFGSGSGLLDLSLQADDTSLGGILDEIYTPEDQKAGAAEGGEEALSPDLAAETEQMPPGDELTDVPVEPIQAMPAMMSIAAEPEPDASSNMIGGLLILSLAVLVYTIIAAASAGIFGVVPAPVKLIEGFIWLVVGVLALVVIGVSVVAFLKGSGGGAPKPPKPKKVKEEKKKKEKKSKKDKGKKQEEEEAKE
jgi:hypothetical protein